MTDRAKLTGDWKADPTEAELDAMIAEQMANLPPWWAASEQAAAKYGTSGTAALGKLAAAIRTRPVRRRTGRRA